jgi:hypothetical protein
MNFDRVVDSVFKNAMRLAISCPKGWQPSSTGQTCTDGKEYRKPEDFGEQREKYQEDDQDGDGQVIKKETGRMGDQEAKSVLHKKLEQHFKDKPVEVLQTELQGVLNDARKSLGHSKHPDNVHKLRQLQDNVISFGAKHGVKVARVV